VADVIRRLLPLLLIALLAAPALARPDDEDEAAVERGRKRWEQLTEGERAKIIEAYERWKRLSQDDRASHREAWEKHFEGLSPAEREELLEKLREVKEHIRLEDDRRRLEEKERRDRWKRDVAHHYQRLEKDLGNDFRRLPKDQRMDLLRWSLGRMAEVMGERVLATLTGEEEEEVRALPEKEKCRRLAELIKKAPAGEREKVRAAVIEEIRELFKLPPEELKAKLEGMKRRHSHSGWLERALKKMGFDDPELLNLLRKVPRHRCHRTLSELRRIGKIENPGKRKKALETLKARLRLEKSSSHRGRGPHRWVR